MAAILFLLRRSCSRSLHFSAHGFFLAVCRTRLSLVFWISEGILKTGHKLIFSSLSTDQAYVSPPPSPSIATHAQPIPPLPASVPSPGSTFPLDLFLSDAPYDQTSLSEALMTHLVILSAVNCIIDAAVQTSFLSLCDATMGE